MTHSADLTDLERQVLRLLESTDDGVSTPDMARHTGMSANYMLVIVRRLRQRGLADIVQGGHHAMWSTPVNAARMKEERATSKAARLRIREQRKQREQEAMAEELAAEAWADAMPQRTIVCAMAAPRLAALGPRSVFDLA